MFVLENGDKIQGDASAATVVDYHISGLTGSTLKNLADGQLAATIGDLYTSAATDLAKTIVLTNTDSVERTINLYHTPSGGTARRILPKNMAIQAGGTILFDGENVSVLSASGGLVSTVAILDGSIVLAKIENIATDSFLGRDTAGTGAVEVLSATTVRTILNVENGATADQTDAEIRAAVAAATDSNVYDDAAVTKLGGIEALADVTDATNVAAAGAVMDADVGVTVQAYDADLTTWAGLTPSANAQSLVTAADYAAMRTLLDVESGVDFDPVGTDNSTDVTLAGTPDYITLAGQVLTRGLIDLSTDVTGTLATGTVPAAQVSAGTLGTGAFTLGGTLNLVDNIVSRPILEDYAIQGSAIGNVGATRTFDCAVANYFTATVDQASTFTFSNPPATGDAGGFRLVLTNGGAFAITFPASVDWDGGTAPTLTAAGVDIIDFTTSDAGTIWYGTVVGSDMK
jgi:hypothetical protein